MTFTIVALGTIIVSSCNKPSTNPPVITFSNTVGYICEDTTLYRGTNYTFWVYATKNGGDDLVESGKISRSVNGGPDSVLQTMSFVTTQFSQYYSYNAADSGTVAKYTFTFGNQNGLTSSASIKITSN
jgi:hypothetical protein